MNPSREAASAVENGLNACRGQPEFSQPKETAEPYLGAIAAASSEFVVSGNSVIGTRIQRCLVASPGPPMSPHHDGWVGALTVCDVASKRPHLIQSSLARSVRLGPAMTNTPAMPVAQGAAGPSQQKPISSGRDASGSKPGNEMG